MSDIKEIEFNGLSLQVEILSYTPPGRPAPIASTPDCPGYCDPGGDEECDYNILSAEIDCPGTHLEFLAKCLEGYGLFEEELYNAICEKIREEKE